ncbi:MAG: ABC transporter ATP-binding protein [Lachnospiraceae bacterium]|nr:ABC transporter ATP-binding protein [Lachnospiraceae bacterium]
MFSKLKYRKDIIHTLLPYTIGVRKYYLMMIICTGLLTLGDLITPLFYKLFIDEVIIGMNFQLMKFVIIGYLTAFVATTLTGYAKKHAEYTFIHKMLYQIKNKIFLGYLSMDFEEYSTMEVGDMKLRLEDDTSLLKEFTTTQTIEYCISFITMTLCAVILFYADCRLAIFSIAAIPVTFLLDDLVSRYEKKINEIKRQNQQKKTTWLQASLLGWREVKALDLSRLQLKHFVEYLHVQALCNAKWINCWTARRLIIPKIKEEFFMHFGLYFIGGLLIASGKLVISDLLVFVVYYEMMATAMKNVSGADAQLQSDMPVIDRFLEQLKKGHCTATNTIISQDLSQEFLGIDIQNVTFRYPNSTMEVLKNINLHIAPGDRIAITGKSGSGKSTLLKLMTGMLSPTCGTIFYNGINLKDINKEQLYRQIGFVMQENILFHMSIRENLRYGKADATEEEMLNACKKSGIYDFITSLPLGLDTVIGEKGIKLSGGQRQRIVLARLFLQNVNIYILDEATSALDQYSESLIQDTLKNFAPDKTIIIVAHRESSIRLCEKLVKIP